MVMVQLSMSLKTCCKVMETNKKKSICEVKVFDTKLFLDIHSDGENFLLCLKQGTLSKFGL